MSRELSRSLIAAAVLAAALFGTAQAGEKKAAAKHIWKPPINVSQALNIKMETKATKKLLKKADEQCLDADCKKQVAECRKVLSTCVIVPAPGSVAESEVENN
jgi:hypothetical protein